MNPKHIWANLSVKDLERTNRFYTAIGFKPNSPHSSRELTSFFFGDNQFVIHFFVEERLKASIKSDLADLTKGNEIVFSLSATSREEVDQCFEEVKKAGGTIYSEPENFEKGYTFGFADPDGHKFNVLYWPGM
jgi:predicted lactoylglutathione lyase